VDVCRLAFVTVASLGLFVLAREMGVGFYRVHGTSMTPTLRPGDYVLANKAAFGDGLLASLRSGPAVPERGEVVVFALRHRNDPAGIKRVVGLPGDTLSMRGGRLCVNGRPLGEPYLDRENATPGFSDRPESWHFSYLLPGKQNHRYQPTGLDWGPLVVPRDAFFVLGDHRDASGDSRDFGFVRSDELVARPFFNW